ncbi:MAG: hypothetical protein PHI06_14765, partial [Desulfobulbaceae bacterium]|nr:hypothetical protein [Desulfobulbaceae bacterium]
MTHDVDAVAKTLPIRLKQGAFNMFNAGRHAAKGEFGNAVGKIKSAVRFFGSSEDWWSFDTLLDKEQQLGICAHFNFYADVREKTIKRWLFDPGYDIADKKIRQLIALIVKHQGTIGLHPTYDSWDSPVIIREQKERLAKMVGQPVTRCRQHWLRFSWSSTWAAQEDAGLEMDTTLLFNDRPGFRAAAALAWHPWNQSEGIAHGIKALPTVLMDSQC